MFRTVTLHRLRPFIVCQSLRNTPIPAVRHGAPVTALRFRLHTVKLRHVDTGSILKDSYKVQSPPLCPSTRCLSTAPPSGDGNLIYTGSLGMAIRGVKLFSYSSSGASLLLMPQILLKNGLLVQSFALQAAFMGIIGFFTFLSPVLLHLVTKGYVIRLYHNQDSDSYTAITCSIFLTEEKTVFHQKQVRIPSVSKMFTTFYADRRGLLVNPDLFPNPQDYNHLMGYDKPFRFDTDSMDKPDES